MRRTTLTSKFHSSPTEHDLTSIMPVRTDALVAVDKSSQFCSYVNTGIRNRFMCVNINVGATSYQVLRLHYMGNGEIKVAFLDYGGKVWYTTVSDWHSFVIFKGI